MVVQPAKMENAYLFQYVKTRTVVHHLPNFMIATVSTHAQKTLKNVSMTKYAILEAVYPTLLVMEVENNKSIPNVCRFKNVMLELVILHAQNNLNVMRAMFAIPIMEFVIHNQNVKANLTVNQANYA